MRREESDSNPEGTSFATCSLKNHPKITKAEIHVGKSMDIAAAHSIYMIPGVLVFINGTEVIREARYMSMDEFNNIIRKLSHII